MPRQVFTTSGTFTVPVDVTEVNVLIVGGGGGGGRAGSGGAGGSGGQVRWESNISVTPAQNITVTVGAGGAGRSGTTGSGSDGASSSFGVFEAIGGGAGAGGGASTPGQGAYGGGGQSSTSGSPSGGIGLVAYSGGSGANAQGGTYDTNGSGGGGGAGGNGGNGAYVIDTSAQGGPGGPGLNMSAQVGTDVGAGGWFGGGGGGGTQRNVQVSGAGGAGGQGGGGVGRDDAETLPGGSGATNTGGGGGGGSGSIISGTTDGGNGGSGVVIVTWGEAPPVSLTVTTAWLTAPENRWVKPSLRVSWYDGTNWGAILPTSSGHALVPNIDNMTTGEVVDDRQNSRPTVVYNNGWLGVLRGHPSQTRFSSFDATDGYAAVVTDAVVPLTATNLDASPIAMCRSDNGYLWAAVAESGTVKVSRSTDNGVSWGAVQTIITMANGSTGIAALAATGTTVVLYVTENNASGDHRYIRTIAQGAGSYAAGSWSSEALPALQGGTTADDHAAIDVTPDGRIVVVSKTTVSSSAQLLYVLVRSTGGAWTQAAVLENGPDDLGYTRPALAITEHQAYVYYGSFGSPTNLYMRFANLDDLTSWSGRTAVRTGSDWSDSAALPTSASIIADGSGSFPVLIHDRTTDQIVLSEQGYFSSGMITIEGVSSAVTANAQTLNIASVVVPSVVNRVLAVGVGFNNDDFQTPTSVVLDPGGQNLALAMVGSSVIDDDAHTSMWYLVNPPVGTWTVRVTLSASLLADDGFTAGAWVLSGVNQTTPVRGGAGQSALATSVTASVTTEPDDMVLGVGFLENSVETSLNLYLSSGTESWSRSSTDDTGIGGYKLATGATTTLTWSHQGTTNDAVGCYAAAFIPVDGEPPAPPVVAVLSSQTFPGFSGDIADGSAIVYDRVTPGDTVVIVTNKGVGGGLYVVGLDGQIRSSWLPGGANSVDYRDFYGDTTWDNRILIATTDRDNNQLRYAWLDRTSKTLTSAGSTSLGWEPYGSCLYVHADGKVYMFVTQRGPDDTSPRNMYQYELTRSGSTVSSTLVRTIPTDSVVEGLVGDDKHGHIFASEENVGLYRYSGSPSGGSSRVAIDTVGAGNLYDDIEDVSLAHLPDRDVLLVSSQGDDSYHLYDAETFEHLRRFTVMRPDGTTQVTGTDGLDVLLGYLGPDFPYGLIVVHDGGREPVSDNLFIDASLVFGEWRQVSVTSRASNASVARPGIAVKGKRPILRAAIRQGGVTIPLK